MPCDELNIDFWAIFRWHDRNKSLSNLETKKIRFSEGMAIYNRYSLVRLENNLFGITIFKILGLWANFFHKFINIIKELKCSKNYMYFKKVDQE